jgi:hypothetical protein
MATRSGRTSTPRGREAPPQRSFPLLPVIIGVALLILVAAGALYYFNQPTRQPAAEVSPGQPVPTMESRDHLPDGTPVQYNTNPPTSGPHWGQAATWGVYPSTPPPDERLVHNLEHGGVVIYYDPNQVDEQTIEQLRNLTRDLRRERTCLVLTQRESIQDDAAIALTAWGVLALLDSYDEPAIRAFWRDHVARGPEFGEGVCG